jgi:hypothetical protein
MGPVGRGGLVMLRGSSVATDNARLKRVIRRSRHITSPGVAARGSRNRGRGNRLRATAPREGLVLRGWKCG